MDNGILAQFMTSVWNEVPHLPPPLAPSLLGNSSANNGAGALTLVLPRPGGYTLGCMLLAVAVGQDTSPVPPAGWIEITSVTLSLNMRSYYRFVDDGVGDPPAGYTWTFSSPVEALGGIISLAHVNRLTPIFDHSNRSTTSVDTHTPEITATPPLSFLVYSAFVDKNEDINATENTLLMTEQFEPRANKNMALWTQPWPQGGNTGDRSFSISTGIAQDIAGSLLVLNPEV